MSEKIHTGYVITDDGSILLQIPCESSRWGFYLCDEDESWDGGLGVASDWEALKFDDPRVTPEDHERLDWCLERA